MLGKQYCSCGEHKECVRKVYSDKNGKLSVKTDEHLQCGIIKKQITQSSESTSKPKDEPIPESKADSHADSHLKSAVVTSANSVSEEVE